MSETSTVDVVVLGAGVAGLHAARCATMRAPESPVRGGGGDDDDDGGRGRRRSGATREGEEVDDGEGASTRGAFRRMRAVVLEARDEVGGRVRAARDAAPWDVNLGPEFAHGDEGSALKRFIDNHGFGTTEREWPDRYYLGGREGRLVRADEAEATSSDVRRVHELFDRLPGAPGEEDADETALEWLTNTVRASDSVIKLAENIYANDFGSSLRHLGMREVIEEKKNWIYGEKYLVLDRPMREVALALADGLDVRTNWEIESVDYSTPGVVRVTRRGGKEVITAKKCIVALPITALRPNNTENRVRFIPRLPAAKTRAAETIQIGNAAKLFVGFRKIVWPEDVFDVVCTNCFLPEFWITKYSKSPLAREVATSREAKLVAETVALVTFFIAGDLADELDKMNRDVMFRRAIDQLDTIFNVSCKEHITTMKYVGWSQERLVQGAYTHPTVNAGDSRALLAAPVSNTLFFAGEATHTGVNPCLQGAMETGARAAAQVRAAVFGIGQSKL